MTMTANEPAAASETARQPEPIQKVSIVISKGTLEGIYPGLIMANGARMEGMEANVFFTFFGLDAITRKKQGKIRVDTVGNPALGMPGLVGIIPGMRWMVTKMMGRKMEELDIPPIPEFVQMIIDSGAGVYGCKATVDMFGLKREDFVDGITDVITVGEFYAMSAGGQIIFT
jgi:peroxiredoxin family protein